jgi:PAS domain S-box-containing protein
MVSMVSGQPVVELTVPGSRFALVGYLDLEALERIVERTRVGEAGDATVIDRTGTVIAHRDRRLVSEQVNISDLTLIRRGLDGLEETAEYDVGGRPRLGSVARVTPSDWVVLVSEPLDKALAQAEHLRVLLLGAFGVVIVAAVTSGLLSARRILEPIDALAARAHRIEEGEYAPPAEKPRGASFPEIDALSKSFDAMASAVEEREEALARSERNFRSLVSAPVVGIVRAGIDGTIHFANDAFARLVGSPRPESLLGTSMTRFYKDPGDRERLVEQARRTGQVANVEVPFVTVEGDERVVLLNSGRDGEAWTTVLVDITELKKAAQDRERLEQELFHAQKLEAVGRLAGSVAHDFNNLLTVIVSHASLLESEFPANGSGREDLAGILDAAQRAAHLTRSLLAYGRKQSLQKRAVDVCDVVRSVEPLLRRICGEDVGIALKLPAQGLGVFADTSQIEQVLVNLCANARDAMPGGGRVEIEARLADIGTESPAGPQAGPYVCIDVRDTGQGIAAGVRNRIFEPFFTTKPPGRGTGLGLSIVEGIVRQHGGQIAVASTPGVGTTFSVFLPFVAAPAASEASAPVPDPTPGGRETILLADDEPSVRRALRATLQRAGYTVVEAVDGEDAVQKFQAHREDVALCLLDVIMPRMNGREAWHAIVAAKPGTRVLFASGYTADILETQRTASPMPDLIAKPVAPAELLRRVRRALDGSA